MEELIPEIVKYLFISGAIIVFAFLLRRFMVNHYPMRLNRSRSSVRSEVLLEISEEFEEPLEQESSPNREKWLRKARKSPLETAMIIRLWLEEDESLREQKGMHAGTS